MLPVTIAVSNMRYAKGRFRKIKFPFLIISALESKKYFWKNIRYTGGAIARITHRMAKGVKNKGRDQGGEKRCG